jgi:hypothetical protein
MGVVTIHIRVLVIGWGCDGNVGPIQAASHQREAGKFKEIFGQPAAILRPAHDAQFQSVDGFRHPVDHTVNCVAAWTPCIPHYMVEGIRTNEMEEEFNLKIEKNLNKYFLEIMLQLDCTIINQCQ